MGNKDGKKFSFFLILDYYHGIAAANFFFSTKSLKNQDGRGGGGRKHTPKSLLNEPPSSEWQNSTMITKNKIDKK